MSLSKICTKLKTIQQHLPVLQGSIVDSHFIFILYHMTDKRKDQVHIINKHTRACMLDFKSFNCLCI